MAAANMYTQEQSSVRDDDGSSFVREEHAQRSVERGFQPAGPGRKDYTKLFPSTYDNIAAVKELVPYTVGSNRITNMPVFIERRDHVFAICGVGGRSDGYMLAFVRAMCLSHAKNSGSVLQPERAEFVVGKDVFNYLTSVVAPLGDEYRRFFRVYADMTRAILKELLSKRGDPAYDDDIRDIDWVAADRGLARYPNLIHDSAEACSGLLPQERAALQSSKAAVLATYTGGNPVDNPVYHRTSGGNRNSTNVSPHSNTSPSFDGPGY